MIALLIIAGAAFVVFVAYARGVEHGVMQAERALRLAASKAPAPPAPARVPDLFVGADYVRFRDLTPVELQRIMAPEASRHTLDS